MLVRPGLAALVCGLTFSMVAGAAAPVCSLVAGWTPQGAARSFGQDNLFEYMDGNAEGYLLYGFQNMQGVTCEKGGVTFVIDVSDFGDADSAYGFFSNNRDPGGPADKVGMGGQIVPRRAIFAKGKYYVEIAANPDGDHSAMLRQWSSTLEKGLEGSSEPPAALNWFPAEKQQSLRLVPESVLGLRLLKRGYVGQYEAGKAFVVMEESPATATELMEKLRARFPGSTPAKVGDEAMQAADQYLGRLCIFRKGRYIGGYANLSDGQDAIALATALSNRLP